MFLFAQATNIKVKPTILTAYKTIYLNETFIDKSVNNPALVLQKSNGSKNSYEKVYKV